MNDKQINKGGGETLILDLDLAQEDTYFKKSAFNLKKKMYLKRIEKKAKKINNYLIVTNSFLKWTVY